jgi:endoglucanase
LTHLLGELSEAFGVSGFEEEVRGIIQSRVQSIADEIHVDPLGNLHAVMGRESPFTLLLDAHMDEVGFLVKAIEEDGFLRLVPVGGWDPRLLPGQTVWVRARNGRGYTGVVGSVPPHVQETEDRKKPFDWKDLFVDVGARDPQEVARMGIRLGSPAVIPQPFLHLTEGSFLGKALDNRAGCAILIRLLESLRRASVEGMRVVAVFSTGEEVGFRGATVAARRWRPQMALILEGTIATDTPGILPHQRVAALGRGPVLTTADRTLIVPERLLEKILHLAETKRIPHQIKTPMVGGTDGGVIHTSSEGVLTAVVAVPCRYIHSPRCLLRREDLLHTEQLVESIVREAPRIYREVGT